MLDCHQSRILNKMTLKACRKDKRMAKKSLSELCPGERARVSELCTGGDMRRRLLDIGLIPETLVECVGQSPLGDPKAYLVRGKIIAIRCVDARGVRLISKGH